MYLEHNTIHEFFVNKKLDCYVDGLESEISVASSYKKNNFAALFHGLSSFVEDQSVLEFGVLGGYSTVAMALAKKAGDICVTSYDLFEDYQYNACSQKDVRANLERYGVADRVELVPGMIDLHNLSKYYKGDEGLVHIDLSNTGDIYKAFEPYFAGKITLLEGGSVERDNVEWMLKFGKNKINPYLRQHLCKRYEVHVINTFPSVTVVWAPPK